MKALFIWDQGINEILTRFLKPLGVEVDCIHRAEYDPHGMTPDKWKHHYPGGRWEAPLMKAHAWLKAGRTDVVHVHSYDEAVPLLSSVAPVVLHYHGSDIRGRWDERRGYYECAERILVSTRNLLEGSPEGTEYLPNPIDTERFKPRGEPLDEALHFSYGAVEEAEEVAAKLGVPMTVLDRNVPFEEVPTLLAKYRYYIDVKRDASGRLLNTKPTDTGSLLGLQALACGCTVGTVWGQRVGLPLEHRPENVAKRLREIYDEVTQ